MDNIIKLIDVGQFYTISKKWQTSCLLIEKRKKIYNKNNLQCGAITPDELYRKKSYWLNEYKKEFLLVTDLTIFKKLYYKYSQPIDDYVIMKTTPEIADFILTVEHVSYDVLLKRVSYFNEKMIAQLLINKFNPILYYGAAGAAFGGHEELLNWYIEQNCGGNIKKLKRVCKENY